MAFNKIIDTLIVIVVSLLIGSSSFSAGKELSELSKKMICLAGIATVLFWKYPNMGRFVGYDKDKNMMFKRKGGSGTQKCYIKGNRVIWGNVDGRWRTHPDDSKTEYRFGTTEIAILDRFSDGGRIRKVFLKENLREYVK